MNIDIENFKHQVLSVNYGAIVPFTAKLFLPELDLVKRVAKLLNADLQISASPEENIITFHLALFTHSPITHLDNGIFCTTMDETLTVSKELFNVVPKLVIETTLKLLAKSVLNDDIFCKKIYRKVNDYDKVCIADFSNVISIDELEMTLTLNGV